jgi:hypothetical protein
VSGDTTRVIGYEPARGTPPHRRVPVAAVFAVIQFAWYVPAVFTAWLVLCNSGLIQVPWAELASAAAAAAPSFGGSAFGVASLARRGQPRAARAWTAAAVIASAAWIVGIFAATIHELRHPSPYPCL